MRRVTNLLMVAATCVALAACGGNEVKGNGKVTVQKRSISAFDKLTVNGDFMVTVNSGQSRSSVEVKADGNIQPYVLSTVAKKALSINVKKGFRLSPTTPIQVTINTSRINEATISGKTVFIVNGLSGDNFKFNVNGVGTSILNGNVKTSAISTNGATHINASGLNAEDVKVNISGLGKITVMAKRKLTVYITGQGQVTYFGQPPIIEQEIYGGGKLMPGKAPGS